MARILYEHTADDTDYEDMARVLLAVSQHGLRVDAPGH